VVDSAGDAGLGEHAVLSWNEAAEMNLSRRRGGFGDAEQEWRSVGGLAAAVHHLLVLFHEAEAIDLLVDKDLCGMALVISTRAASDRQDTSWVVGAWLVPAGRTA
jgi:hypothetical protein